MPTTAVPYKGVSLRYNRYSAKIAIDGKSVHLGMFDTAEAAARMFDARAVALGRRLNFPDEHGPPTKKRAAEEDWVICVPQQASLPDGTVPAATLQAHIMVPSPFFKSEYLTLSKSSVRMDGNMLRVKRSAKGFPEDRDVQIVNEVPFYNSEFKPFRVLCLESSHLLPSRTACGFLGSPHARLRLLRQPLRICRRIRYPACLERALLQHGTVAATPRAPARVQQRCSGRSI